MLFGMVDEAASEHLIGHQPVKIDSLQPFFWWIEEQRTVQESSGSLRST
jgi:hypothetical protein